MRAEMMEAVVHGLVAARLIDDSLSARQRTMQLLIEAQQADGLERDLRPRARGHIAAGRSPYRTAWDAKP